MSPSAFGTPPIASLDAAFVRRDLDSSSSSNDPTSDDGSTSQLLVDPYKDQSNIPPTLSKSKAPPLTLSMNSTESSAESPTLLPPASEERVRSLSNPCLESKTLTVPPSPFALKSPATVDVNPLSASVDKSETSVESAQASLSRLSQGWKETESPDIEMKPMAQFQDGDEDSVQTSGDDQSPENVTPEASPQESYWTGVPEDNSIPNPNLGVENDLKDLSIGPEETVDDSTRVVPSLDESLQNMVQSQVQSTPPASSSHYEDSSPSPPGETV